MFLVFNKDKIMAFVVACSTVFALFLMTSLFAKAPENTIQTVSMSNNESKENNNIETNINLEDNNAIN